MSRHVSYRGITIDMDSLRRENEKVTAIGNMKVNARGDEIKGGQIIKNIDEIARENYNTQSAVVNTGLKGPLPVLPTTVLEAPKQKVTKAEKNVKEVELPNGDIIMKENDES
jgi:hypothetical protein